MCSLTNPEAVVAEESGEDPETVLCRKPKKKREEQEDDLEGLPVIMVEHSLPQDEQTVLFGEEGFKQLLDKCTADTVLPRQKLKWRNTM